jgi:hypothetical protein
MRKLEARVYLRHGKGEEKNIKEPKQKSFTPKLRPQIPDVSVWDLGWSGFFRKKSNLIRDRYLVCFEKIFLYPYKRATFCYL